MLDDDASNVAQKAFNGDASNIAQKAFNGHEVHETLCKLIILWFLCVVCGRVLNQLRERARRDLTTQPGAGQCSRVPCGIALACLLELARHLGEDQATDPGCGAASVAPRSGGVCRRRTRAA